MYAVVHVGWTNRKGGGGASRTKGGGEIIHPLPPLKTLGKGAQLHCYSTMYTMHTIIQDDFTF